MSREVARWVFTEGTPGGAPGCIEYEDGHLFVHNDTCIARGNNSPFDLTRKHLYGHLDKECPPDTPMSERPSYRAMCQFANGLPEIRAMRATEELQDTGEAPEATNDDWLKTDSAPAVAEAVRNAIPNRVQTADEFSGELKPREWRVKGVQLLDAEICVIYGDSGSGKSFWIDDLGACIHLGRPWNKRKVTKGRVVKIVAEGAGDHRYRLHAQAVTYGVALGELPLVIDNAPDLFDREQALDVVKQIQAAGGCDELIIDTLSATFTGDENGSDMGVYLRNVRLIQRLLGCTVWIVHHCGKNAALGARGWSGLRATVDVEIEVVREGELRSAEVTKAKGAGDGAKFGFKLVPVVLGRDRDDEDYGSMRVEYTDDLPTGASKTRKRPRGNPLLVLKCMEEKFRIAAPTSDELFNVVGGSLVCDVRRRNEYFRSAVQTLADTETNKWLWRHSGDRLALTAALPGVKDCPPFDVVTDLGAAATIDSSKGD